MQTLKLTKKYEKYPEYKDSGVEWFGKVPKDWRVGPLRSVLVERIEKNKKIVSENILSVMKDVGVIRYSDKGDIGNKSSDRPENYKIVYPGDIVINSMNLVIGSVGQSKELGVTSSVYIIYHSRNEEMFADYYHYLFRNKSWQKTLGRLGKGIMELRESINSDLLKIEPVPIPSLNQQRVIVSFLDEKTSSIDQIIEKKQKLIELLKEKRTTLINQIVTKGLDPKTELVDSGIEWVEKIPKNWKKFKIKRLAERIDYGISESLSKEGDIKVLTMAHIQDGKVIIPETGSINSIDQGLLLKNDDLLFNRTNSFELVGKVGIYSSQVDEKCTFASYLVRIRTNNKIFPQYANYLFNSPNFISYIRGLALRSINQANLNPNRYSQIMVPVPPVQDQKNLIDHMSKKAESIDLAVKNINKSIEFLQEFKSSLISNVVTGKIKV